MRFLKVFTLASCAPCKAIAPLIDEVASAKNMLVSRIDIQEHTALAELNGVRKVPTLKLYEDDRVLATHTGALTKSQLEQFLDTR